MAIMSQNIFSGKALLGAALLIGGSALLVGETRVFAVLLAGSRIETCGDVLASLPALAVAVLRACTGLIFSQHAFFTLLRGLLLSFWPLALIAVGAVLLLRGA